jgi:hypothetical protein
MFPGPDKIYVKQEGEEIRKIEALVVTSSTTGLTMVMSLTFYDQND